MCVQHTHTHMHIQHIFEIMANKIKMFIYTTQYMYSSLYLSSNDQSVNQIIENVLPWIWDFIFKINMFYLQEK